MQKILQMQFYMQLVNLSMSILMKSLFDQQGRSSYIIKRNLYNFSKFYKGVRTINWKSIIKKRVNPKNLSRQWTMHNKRKHKFGDRIELSVFIRPHVCPIVRGKLTLMLNLEQYFSKHGKGYVFFLDKRRRLSPTLRLLFRSGALIINLSNKRKSPILQEGLNSISGPKLVHSSKPKGIE